jgi:arylformamidase
LQFSNEEFLMAVHDAAWHDRMYNNRALVPDFADHFARWQQASAQARKTLAVQRDLRYGEGPNETLDVFPAARPGAPVVVFIHGGYWRSLPCVRLGRAWWWSTMPCARDCPGSR